MSKSIFDSKGEIPKSSNPPYKNKNTEQQKLIDSIDFSWDIVFRNLFMYPFDWTAFRLKNNS